jgi:hypothetical protein
MKVETVLTFTFAPDSQQKEFQPCALQKSDLALNARL